MDLATAGPALRAIEAATPRLSPDDVARAARLQDRVAADDWTAARVALRLVLEQALGVAIRGRPFAVTSTGRPSLEGEPVAFSLSHAARHALIGIAAAPPLGVDLEGERQVRMGDDRRLAIEEAAASLASLPLPAGGPERFLQAWVRLEALAKAEGEGLARVLSRTRAFGAGRRRGGETPDLRPPHIRVADVALAPSLFAAVAMDAAAPGIEVAWLPPGESELTDFALRHVPLAR